MSNKRKVTATIGGKTVTMYVVEGAVLNKETGECNDIDEIYEESEFGVSYSSYAKRIGNEILAIIQMWRKRNDTRRR